MKKCKKEAHFRRLHAHEAASPRSDTSAAMRDGNDSNGIRTRLQVIIERKRLDIPCKNFNFQTKQELVQ
jgi:hypothetical protein